MPCQLFRTNGKVDKVLAPNEKPSILYEEILKTVKQEGAQKFIDSIPYLTKKLFYKYYYNFTWINYIL